MADAMTWPLTYFILFRQFSQKEPPKFFVRLAPKLSQKVTNIRKPVEFLRRPRIYAGIITATTPMNRLGLGRSQNLLGKFLPKMAENFHPTKSFLANSYRSVLPHVEACSKLLRSSKLACSAMLPLKFYLIFKNF